MTLFSKRQASSEALRPVNDGAEVTINVYDLLPVGPLSALYLQLTAPLSLFL